MLDQHVKTGRVDEGDSIKVHHQRPRIARFRSRELLIEHRRRADVKLALDDQNQRAVAFDNVNVQRDLHCSSPQKQEGRRGALSSPLVPVRSLACRRLRNATPGTNEYVEPAEDVAKVLRGNRRKCREMSFLLLALMRLRAEPGQTMAEYGILVAVIAIVVIAAAILFGGSLSQLFGNNASNI